MPLQPCNACGFKKPKPVTIAHNGHVAFAVKCPTCGLNTGPQKTEERATNRWNANHRHGA